VYKQTQGEVEIDGNILTNILQKYVCQQLLLKLVTQDKQSNGRRWKSNRSCNHRFSRFLVM